MPVAKEISRDTFNLAKLLQNLQSAELYRCSIVNEQHTGPGARKLLNEVGTHIRLATRTLTNRLSPESMKIVEAELLQDEYTIQMEAITSMLLAVPKGIRDQIETHIEGLYNIYKLNQ